MLSDLWVGRLLVALAIAEIAISGIEIFFAVSFPATVHGPTAVFGVLLNVAQWLSHGRFFRTKHWLTLILSVAVDATRAVYAVTSSGVHTSHTGSQIAIDLMPVVLSLALHLTLHHVLVHDVSVADTDVAEIDLNSNSNADDAV